MNSVQELLISLLMDLVDRIPDTPKRVLFKGVSDLHEGFSQRAAIEHPDWAVRVTEEGADLVGARNDPAIPVLVVFYRSEVRERESLNAFRLFNEDEIAKELLSRLETNRLLPGLPEPYSSDERDRLAVLLDLVYPSLSRLAQFLLAGKETIGDCLPLLGLFRDPNLSLDIPLRQWTAQLRENQQAAALRWRDFIEKGIGTKLGRQTLGDANVALLVRAETDPSGRSEVLAAVTLLQALSVLNPPTRLVERMMMGGYTRDQSEELVRIVKAGGAGTSGGVDLSPYTRDLPDLPDRVKSELERLAPVDDGDDGDRGPELDLRRVGFCLEGLLRLARQEHRPFPRRFEIRRTDIDGDYHAIVKIGDDGRLRVELNDEAARFLSVPGAAGVSELEYEVRLPDETRFRFTMSVMPRWLEQYAEDWLDDAYWEMVGGINPDHAGRWEALRRRVTKLRDVVDPDWKLEPSDDDERDDTDREPNNPIYALFDLLYFAHRELFDAFLDEWLAVATLPWRDTRMAQKPKEWREAVAGLLRLGIARRSNGGTAVFPFYPLRLAWYHEVFWRIEGWLARAARSEAPLVFEPSVLAEQLKPVDRPRVLFEGRKRLVEAASGGFFVVQFVHEDQHRRARPPLYRAQQKLQQFGRMWPFSLARLHLAFQPGDAGAEIYRLLLQESEAQPDAAYRVRALVESTGMNTVFDQQLLSTSEETVDLLTQEHYESLLPRVDYTKERMESGENRWDKGRMSAPAKHITLLVDAFSEESFDFGEVVGRINMNPDWVSFDQLIQGDSLQNRERLLLVDISAPPYHTGPVQSDCRDLVYVPLSGERPEYLRILHDSLTAWQYHGAFNRGVYFERVRWDADRLRRLHDHADWVLLFDRTLDKSLFETLTPDGVRLIDYYPNLPGGYKMSVSSGRADAVEWQLARVLQQFFSPDELNSRRVASEMLEKLSTFAGGLLLKTLGGGSLAQELLGLYATYLSLLAEGEYEFGRDWLIPLDDYQGWFGRRTRRGRRADLLVLRNPEPDVLRMVAVESKWYKQPVSIGFVRDEFGDDGQMRTTVASLRSLFDPTQDRLDKHHWQRTLTSLLDSAPGSWSDFRQCSEWSLEVDGVVYVHQYAEEGGERLRDRASELLALSAEYLRFPADEALFCRGPAVERLRLKSRREILDLLAQGGMESAGQKV